MSNSSGYDIQLKFAQNLDNGQIGSGATISNTFKGFCKVINGICFCNIVGYYTYIGSYSNVPKWYISNLPESKYGDFDILYTYFNAGGSVHHINFYYISQKNDNNFPFAQTTMHFYFFYKVG